MVHEMSHITTISSNQLVKPASRLYRNEAQQADATSATEPEAQDGENLPSRSPTPMPQLEDEHEELLGAHRESYRQGTGRPPTCDTATPIAPDLSKPLVFEKSRPLPPPTWLPYTLRKSFLLPLGVVSLGLSITLAVLCWYSVQNHGLGRDDGSTRLLLGWRYTPTLVTVLFTQALAIVSEDVKRTEAFARMARPRPAKAKYTLLHTLKVWWKSLFEGLSRRRSGGQRSWLLAVSSLIAGVGIMVISPFSSSIFVAKDVIIKDPIELQRFISGQGAAINLQSRRETYLRTISGFLHNTSTSIWVSDSHAIFPLKTPPEGIWEAETMVIQMESTCVPATMTEQTELKVDYFYDRSSSKDKDTVKSKGFKIRTDDGCEVQMQSPVGTNSEYSGGLEFSITSDNYIEDPFMRSGGAYWTNMSSTYVSWQDMVREQGPAPHLGTLGDGALTRWGRTFIYDLSEQCRGRDLVLVTPPWSLLSIPLLPNGTTDQSAQHRYSSNFTVRAEICTPTIYEARIPVTVSMGGKGAHATFDPLELSRYRKPISKDMIQTQRLDDYTFGRAWERYTAIPGDTITEDSSGLEGVSMLLSQVFKNNTNMLRNSSLTTESSRLRARFFHELLLSSIVDADAPSEEKIIGSNTVMGRRIVVVQEVAITLAVLLFITACYSFFTLISASTAHRPLQLRTDPATVVGTTQIFYTDSSFASTLRSLPSADREAINDNLSSKTYALDDGGVTESLSHPKAKDVLLPKNMIFQRIIPDWARIRKSKKVSPKDWRPRFFQKRWLVVLISALAAVTVTILVLHTYAAKQKLYRTAFVYQMNLGFLSTSFSPQSVVGTLIAVIIGLCWDSIDKPMRVLQPYLAMSRKPSDMARGVSLSYQSTFWIGTVIQAVPRHHWLLVMVAIGTTLSQILVVSMAALFERQTVLHTTSLEEMGQQLSQTTTYRQLPFDFRRDQEFRPFFLDEGLLKTSQTVWLANALDEIISGSQTPPWTRDEWIYTPVNMDSLREDTIAQDHRVADFASTNVSFITTALRSRLECSSIPVANSDWLDRAEDVFSNRTKEAISGYILPPVLFEETSFATPVYSAPRRMACCTNGTSQESQSVIAYWSSNSSIADQPLFEYADPVPSVAYGDNSTNGGPDPSLKEDLSPDVKASLKTPRAWSQNFTIKWIVGSSASTEISGENPIANVVSNKYNHFNEKLLYFVKVPRVAILNCVPVIEQANARISVARSSNQVLNAEMIDSPQLAADAWDYAYDVEYPNPYSNFTRGNVSYGVFFTSQLLTAPHIIKPAIYSSWLVYNQSLEDVSIERFNIRDKDRGLNMDFMSYANLHKVNNDPNALLDTALLLDHSEKTFQTFFKHFAVSGNWLGSGSIPKSTVFQQKQGLYSSGINGTVTERIEILSMNETATWLSVAILVALTAILVVLIVFLQVVYPKNSMQHRVECLADVLAMIASSEELVNMAHEMDIEKMERSSVQTRLGWFRDKRGDVRWGVEIADGSVEWVEKGAN